MSSPPVHGPQRVNVLGCELRYLRTGSGPTVVLLHTLRTQLEYWDPVRRLLGQELDLVVPDLPGHGRSAAPPVDYTATYFTDVTERFLDACDVQNAILVGESIGASIALALAARKNPRIARIVALNPYDYGRGGGIRRSSPLAKVLFTVVHWPLVGPLVMSAGTKGILRRVLEGGLHDPRKLPADLLEQLWECGSLPGHGRAFVSLCREWKGWIAARSAYPEVTTPVTLVYGEHDWSRPEERDANARALPSARVISLAACGHFSSLEQPDQIADIIRAESSRVASAS